uniref:Uncharacterized protein n=1 Tax=Anguilla anguilla TaxID=7936 RepID=A0A0E9PP04_ANGAN
MTTYPATGCHVTALAVQSLCQDESNQQFAIFNFRDPEQCGGGDEQGSRFKGFYVNT